VEDLEDLVVRLSAEPPPAFLGGNVTVPHVAALKGHHLRALLELSPANIPSIVRLSMVKTTWHEHSRMLKVLRNMPNDLLNLPVADAVLETLMRLRQAKKWRWSTTIKYLATCQGALAQLPLHRATPTPILLRLSPVWVAGLRATARQARFELPNQPKAATWQQVKSTLKNEASILTFSAILLAWMTSARVGCILQLSKNDITWHPDNSLSVRFRKGKGVLLRGTAYTVHTGQIPQDLQPRLKRFMEDRRSILFPPEYKGDAVRLALRRTDPHLEQRSLRRGSLQALAAQKNMTDEVLLLFSGHSTTKTLRRYLNWGVLAAHTRRLMCPAGSLLLGTGAHTPQ